MWYVWQIILIPGSKQMRAVLAKLSLSFTCMLFWLTLYITHIEAMLIVYAFFRNVVSVIFKTKLQLRCIFGPAIISTSTVFWSNECKREGVLNGHEQQRWYSDWTHTEEVECWLVIDREVILVLERLSIYCVWAGEMLCWLDMGSGYGLLTRHG